MATIYKVDCPNRKPLFEGVQGENEARSIQFDITAWVEELGAGAVTATAKRPTDAQPYPVTIEQGDGNIVTWKPTSTDTAFEGVGSFQLEYTVDDVLAKTCIWSTQIAPSLDPAGDPPDPYDNWLASMREVAAAAQQSANDSAASAQQAAGEVTNAQTEVKNAEAWAVGTKGGVDVPTTDETYHNNAKYWAEKSNESQYGAYITKSASGSIASFADGADNVPMKSLKVAIVPKQAGSGDPSPDNVRPITGTSTSDIIVSPTTDAEDGHTTPVPLGQTVYGGELKPISGELVINKVIFDLGNASYWSKITQSGHTVFYYGFPDGDRTQSVFDVMCSAYKNYTPSDYAENNIVHGYASERWGFCRVAIRDDSLADKTEDEFKAAMAGIKCVYPLANPTTVQLTPAEVRTLLGDNNVWSDAGDVEVEYRADPTLAYAELQALILENN